MHGSTAKIKIYPCYYCSISSDELVHFKTNNNRCTYCIEQNNLQCVYWEISNSKNIEVMHRHIINIINDNQVENETCDGFVEKT